MTRQRKSFSDNGQSSQSGNAMIYVLIIVALFAALSMTLARQTDTSETGTMSARDVEIYAAQIMQSPAPVKQAIDQMLFTGATINPPPPLPPAADRSLNFAQPGDGATFDNPPHIWKVYHPKGGGLLKPHFPDAVFNQISTPPDAGVYLGRFNNVEWTESTAQDVIYTVFQINRQICEKINEQLTGSTTIPALDDNMEKFLVDPSLHPGSAVDFMAANCDDPTKCDGQVQLCVSNTAATAFSFYSIIASE